MKIEQFAIPTTADVSFGRAQGPKAGKPESRLSGFSGMLKKSVEKVNALQKQADTAIDDLVLGDNKDIVQTMIMMEKADISFRLVMQIRNKIIQAYEEIMRMQV